MYITEVIIKVVLYRTTLYYNICFLKFIVLPIYIHKWGRILETPLNIMQSSTTPSLSMLKPMIKLTPP